MLDSAACHRILARKMGEFHSKHSDLSLFLDRISGGKWGIQGGTPRYWIIGGKRPTDFDFPVMVGPMELEEKLKGITESRTFLGGHRFHFKGIQVDVWAQEGGFQEAVERVPIALDAIIVTRDGHVHENYFFQAVNWKTNIFIEGVPIHNIPYTRWKLGEMEERFGVNTPKEIYDYLYELEKKQ